MRLIFIPLSPYLNNSLPVALFHSLAASLIIKRKSSSERLKLGSTMPTVYIIGEEQGLKNVF
jgi:hypothetical protein